jgi:hypothetical protein
MRGELLQTSDVIGENLAISLRQAVIVHNAFQRQDDVVQLTPVVSSATLHVLKLIQFPLCLHQPGLIPAEWESAGLNVVEVLTDPGEHMHPPILAPEGLFAIVVKRIPVAVKPRTISAALDGRRRRRCVAPKDVEGVTLRAILRIVNANDRRAAAARVASQLLAAAAVDARESKVGGIRRQRPGAFKSPPLRLCSPQVPKSCGAAANFYLGGPVNHYFNGTFSSIWRSAANLGHPARLDLCVHPAY